MLKANLFVLGLVIFVSIGHSAEICSTPKSVTLAEEVAQFSLKANDHKARLFQSTLKAPSEQELLTLLEQATALSKQIPEKITQLDIPTARLALTMYLGALKDLRASQALLKGQITPIQVQMTTSDFLRLNPSQTYSLAGLTAEIHGPVTTVYLNAESQFTAHLEATARVGETNVNKQYFETAKCVLTRTFIEKSKTYAGLLGKNSTLKIPEEAKACRGFQIKEFLGGPSLVDYEGRQHKVLNLVLQSSDQFNEDEIKLIRQALSTRNLELTDLLAWSSQEDSDPELNSIDQILNDVEQVVFQNDPLLRSLSSMAPRLKQKFLEITGSCGQAYELPNFEKLYQRLLAFYLADGLSQSPILAFTKDPDQFSENILEALTYALTEFTQMAATINLGLSGQLLPEDMEAQSVHTRGPLTQFIKNEIRNLGLHLDLTEALKNSDLDTTVPVLDNYPALREAANEIHHVMNPETPKSEMKYNVAAIAKLFDGEIGTLSGHFRFYTEQILTRQSFADRQEVWHKAHEFLQKDQAQHGYDCVKTNLIQSAIGFLQNLSGKPPSASVQRQKQCHLMVRLSEHLGLAKETEPTRIGEVWPSFEKHYDHGDLKIFEGLYREHLKIEKANVFRLLDVPLKDLGLKRDGQLYDFVATSNEEEQKNQLVNRSIQIILHNVDTEALSVIHSKDLSDLHSLIGSSKILNELLGSQYLFPRLLQHHQKYQDNLIRRENFDQRMNQQLIGNLTTPIFVLGGAWVLRGLALRTPGFRWLGTGLQTAAGSTRMLTQGYMSALSWVFAGGAVAAYSWDQDIGRSLAHIDQLKLTDAILFEDDVGIVDYNSYVTKKTALHLDRKQARFDMWLHGAFAASGVVFSVFDSYMASRATMGVYSPRPPGWFSRMGTKLGDTKPIEAASKHFLRRGAYLDRFRIRNELKWLGNPNSLSVSSLQYAKASSKHPLAEQAYLRIIHRLGQRVNRALGHPEKERLVAKELFGSEGATHELSRMSAEYARLFPDVIRGAL